MTDKKGIIVNLTGSILCVVLTVCIKYGLINEWLFQLYFLPIVLSLLSPPSTWRQKQPFPKRLLDISIIFTWISAVDAATESACMDQVIQNFIADNVHFISTSLMFLLVGVNRYYLYSKDLYHNTKTIA